MAQIISLRASLIALTVNALGFYPMRVPLIALSAAIILAGLTTRRQGETEKIYLRPPCLSGEF